MTDYRQTTGIGKREALRGVDGNMQTGAKGDSEIQTGAPAHALISLKGGNLFLRSGGQNLVTDEVLPGQEVFAVGTVSNGALTSTFDPDTCGNNNNPCGSAGIFSEGYCFQLTATPSWSQPKTIGPDCVKMATIGTGDRDIEFIFFAPEEKGTYSIQFRLEAMGSNESGTYTEEVVVTDHPTSGRGENGNGGGGGSLLQTVINNPVLSGVGLIGGVVALRSTLEDE